MVPLQSGVGRWWKGRRMPAGNKQSYTHLYPQSTYGGSDESNSSLSKAKWLSIYWTFCLFVCFLRCLDLWSSLITTCNLFLSRTVSSSSSSFVHCIVGQQCSSTVHNKNQVFFSMHTAFVEYINFVTFLVWIQQHTQAGLYWLCGIGIKRVTAVSMRE